VGENFDEDFGGQVDEAGGRFLGGRRIWLRGRFLDIGLLTETLETVNGAIGGPELCRPQCSVPPRRI
jgi:hypothetical protein